MLNLKIGKNQKMVIEINGERVEMISDKNVILSIIADKTKVSIKREKIPFLDSIAYLNKVSNPQEKEQN